MITKQQIIDLAKQYLATNDLATFSHSFAPLFYDIENTGDADTAQFAYQIEALLARMTAGPCSEPDFQSALESLLPSLSVVIQDQEVGMQQKQLTFLANHAVAGVGTGKVIVFAGISPSVGFGSIAAPQDIHRTNISLLPLQQLITAG
jgi:hypothetical protein